MPLCVSLGLKKPGDFTVSEGHGYPLVTMDSTKFGDIPYYRFFIKNSKRMHQMIQLISNFFNKKIMLPFMQLHIYYVYLMKQIHMKISKS